MEIVRDRDPAWSQQNNDSATYHILAHHHMSVEKGSSKRTRSQFVDAAEHIRRIFWVFRF